MKVLVLFPFARNFRNRTSCLTGHASYSSYSSIRTKQFQIISQVLTHPVLNRQQYRILQNALHFSTSLPDSSMSSVSKEEVLKFSGMAQQWWDPKTNPLIAMNPTRISFIVQTLQQKCQQQQQQQHSSAHSVTPISNWKQYEPLVGLKILDVGCGGGLLSESLARLGGNVTAIDPSETIVRAAQEHSFRDERTRTITYRPGVSVEDIAQEFDSNNFSLEEKFDAICILEVIEHTADPLKLLHAASSLLKRPNGLLFVSTINRSFKSYALAVLGAEYIAGLLPIGTHSWTLFRSPDEVERLMVQCGLSTWKVQGMVFTPSIHGCIWRLDSHDFDMNWIGAYVIT